MSKHLSNSDAMVRLIDGLPEQGLPLDDRGLAYGDGVFETIMVSAGQPLWLNEHLVRLRRGAEALGITAPRNSEWACDVQRLQAAADPAEFVIKLLLTRGSAGRGYAPMAPASPRRIALRLPAPESMARERSSGIHLRWCETRLAIQPRLAGIKHLNRLEQVLARAEWSDPGVHEGLMLDTGDRVVCATAANLFVRGNGRWVTPAVTRCGVAGVCRAFLMVQLEAAIVDLSAADVLAAEELFVCNSVRGILPVVALGDRRWPVGSATRQVVQQLANAFPAFFG